jgi:hypothetical protein
VRRLLVAASAAILAGCGSSVDVQQQENQAIKSVAPTLRAAGVSPSVARQAAQGGLKCPAADRGADRGTATFTFNGGNRISFTQDACPVIEAITHHPELSYNGPAGCRGQFFVGDGTTSDPAGGLVDWFRYGAHDAYLIRRGNEVYHFASAPRISHGRLKFDHDFGDERIVVTVSCPRPRPSGWLLPRDE